MSCWAEGTPVSLLMLRGAWGSGGEVCFQTDRKMLMTDANKKKQTKQGRVSSLRERSRRVKNTGGEVWGQVFTAASSRKDEDIL